jgi:hypothetical protein
MTPAEFHRALSRTKLKPRASSIARRVLVEGVGIPAAGREAGVSPQCAREAVMRVLREHKGIVGCPHGWVCLTVCVPEYGPAHWHIDRIANRELRNAGLLV